MRKLINLILVINILINFGCNNSLSNIHKSKECQGYFERMKKDWVERENHYEVKGNPPYLEEGENREKYQRMYFNENCLVGLPEKKLKKVIGKPNLKEQKHEWQIYKYCLNMDCSHQFIITLDSLSIVQSALLNPQGISKD